MFPEPQDAIAFQFEKSCPLFVVLLLSQMLAAIQFNYKFLFDGTEIGNIVANGVLSTESNSQLIVSDL